MLFPLVIADKQLTNASDLVFTSGEPTIFTSMEKAWSENRGLARARKRWLAHLPAK